MTHLEKLYSALYVSDLWYTVYEWESLWAKEFKHRLPKHRILYYKTKCIVEFDRELNRED